MATVLDQITKLLSGLATGSNTKVTLRSLNLAAASVPDSELREYVPKIDVERLFTCFSTSDREQVESTCEILGRILTCFQPSQVLAKYGHWFAEGLQHPQQLVVQFVLQQLRSAARDAEAARLLAADSALVVACLRLVGRRDAGVALAAAGVLTSLPGAVLTGDAGVVDEVRAAAAQSDEARYRVHEMVVTLAAVSAQQLAALDDAGLLQPLLDDATSPDLLGRCNALEVLSSLAAARHGSDYLQRRGVVDRLTDAAAAAVASAGAGTLDAVDGLVLPATLKFLGAAARFQPQLLDARDAVLAATFFELVRGADVALAVVAMETLAFIASTGDGKRALDRQGKRMDEAVAAMGRLLHHANTDVRLRALASVSQLVAVDDAVAVDEDADVVEAVRRWFHQLAADPVASLLAVLKQPFHDLRLRTLDVFLQLSRHPWALQLMSRQPGFVEFLLDRQAEPTKECLERKFDIVKSVVGAGSASQLFTEFDVALMNEHVRQGPWFSRAQSSVAFERVE